MSLDKVIVVGGGLAGLSAAHTVLERGGRVLLLDKNAFMGGNSTKATSGINGALTRQQTRLGIQDSVDTFLADTAKSATSGKPSEPTAQAKVLVLNSASAVEWLGSAFNLDLSIVNRLGGHSFPRTHRGPERFPGMTITYALMEKFEAIAKADPYTAQVRTSTEATKLITDSNGTVIGVEWKNKKNGQTGKEFGSVVLATGGFGADFSKEGLLAQLRPDLLHLPTTNGDHCTGDGIKMGVAIGADAVDMNQVQVHPTGLVHPDEPNAKVKFLAAEALRGVGGLLITKDGERFCDDLGTRDYVSGEMFKHKGDPYRLVLNSTAAKEIEWHCKHYMGRGLMKRYEHGKDLAKDMGIPVDKLKKTFDDYNAAAEAKKQGKDLDPYKKRFFPAVPFKVDDYFYVAWVCPVVHYCMGGLRISPAGEVLNKAGAPIPGLFAAGEVTGGVHGNNRLGGSSLIDCVVYGRVSGDSSAKYLLTKTLKAASDPNARVARLAGHLSPELGAGISANISVDPASNRVRVDLSWPGAGSAVAAPSASSDSAAPAPAAETKSEAPAAAAPASKTITLDEVAKHNKESDCWVVVNGQVLDVTKFMHDHPGGKQAILLFAGRDASAEFNMLHKPDVVAKYAPEAILGNLDPKDVEKLKHAEKKL